MWTRWVPPLHFPSLDAIANANDVAYLFMGDNRPCSIASFNSRHVAAQSALK